MKTILSWDLLHQKLAWAISVFMLGAVVYSFISEIGYKIYRKHIRHARMVRNMDRIGGGVLGALKGIVIVYLISYLFSGV